MPFLFVHFRAGHGRIADFARHAPPVALRATGPRLCVWEGEDPKVAPRAATHGPFSYWHWSLGAKSQVRVRLVATKKEVMLEVFSLLALVTGNS